MLNCFKPIHVLLLKKESIKNKCQLCKPDFYQGHNVFKCEHPSRTYNNNLFGEDYCTEEDAITCPLLNENVVSESIVEKVK